MAKKSEGTTAPYSPKEYLTTTWCTGEGNGSLGSTSFNSCVGLVLYEPATKRGAVAHFPGSLGTKEHANTVDSDIAEILADVCPNPNSPWRCWIFGGQNLTKKANEAVKTIALTQRLIKRVRQGVLNHLGAHRQDVSDPEALGAEQYVGHLGVSLNLGNGKVTWEDPQ